MAWNGKYRNRSGLRRPAFRSGLETKTAAALEALGIPVAFETFKLPYTIPETRHYYTPDFLLPNGIIIETKGIFDTADRNKHILIHQEWPELDIRFVFYRASTPLYKGSPTTYADWADQHGFRYANRAIPEAWLKERGPKRSPKQVLGAELKPTHPRRG